MNESQIRDIEQQMYQQYITDPLKLEEEVNNVSKEVASKLVLGNKEAVSFLFLNNQFIVRAKPTVQQSKRVIMMVVSNEETRKLAGNSYIPYTVTAEVDNNFSMLENYEAIVQTFLKHVSNTERPEVLDDD